MNVKYKHQCPRTRWCLNNKLHKAQTCVTFMSKKVPNNHLKNLKRKFRDTVKGGITIVQN